MVRDLGSRNGTFVAHQRVTEAELPSGALLTIGAITFRAEYETPTNAAPSEQKQSSTIAERRLQLSDSVIRISESELYTTEGLSDESFGIDSGHFGGSSNNLDD
jgi:pSer/pThr/pTyr-binding forkhead associated (FHA) protein